MGAMNVGQASPYIEAFSMAKGAAAVIFSIIDREPPIDSFSEAGVRPAAVTGNIELRGVHFNYPSRPDVPVLQGINLTIEAGKTVLYLILSTIKNIFYPKKYFQVSLVGASGCGKSTVMQLVQVSCDWLRAGHVTPVLTSDWCRGCTTQRLGRCWWTGGR